MEAPFSHAFSIITLTLLPIQLSWFYRWMKHFIRFSAFRGQRFSIQNYPTISDDVDIDEVISKASLSKEQKSCLLGKHFSKGKLVGKTAFMGVNATYRHEQFIADFIANLGKSRRLEDIYNSVHSEHIPALLPVF